MLTAYTIVLSFVALLRFSTFRTYIDLGIFDQAFSSALRGSFFHETPDLVAIPSGSFLGTHFAPLVFLLVLVYAIYPHPQTLLVVQTPFIALGAVPVYLIARHLLRAENISIALAGVYLISPAIQSLNLFDFHLEAFLPFFLGMAYYFLLTKNWRPYFPFLGLSLMTIEFASIIVLAMSVASLILGRKRLKGLLSKPRSLLTKEELPVMVPIFTIVLASAYFYFSIAVSAVFAGAGASPRTLLGGFFPDFGEWIAAGFLAKTTFWLLLLANTMFLPIISRSRLLLVAPWFLVTIISSNPVYYVIGYQYSGAFVAPYLIIALVHAMHKLPGAANFSRFSVALFIGILLFSAIVTPLSPLAQYHFAGITYEEGLPIPTSHDAVIYRIMNMIPANASILTQNNFFTHFTSRPDAYLYLPNNSTHVSFILGDMTSRWYTSHEFGQASLSQVVPGAISSGLYTVIAYQDGVILLEKNSMV